MKCKAFSRRAARTIAACAAAVFLSTAAAAASPYTMTLHDGFICVVEGDSGTLLYRSDVPASLLSQRDRLLLEAGIPLETQADFTRAVEDFCS